MKTSRTDVERNKQQTRCPNSSISGHSRTKLRFGDLFVYRRKVSHCGAKPIPKDFLARCHGRVKPPQSGPWYILAQVANSAMTFSYERWIEPEEVIEIIPAAHTNPHILKFFEETEDYFSS